ncbi:hypothetical protein AXF42_Ash004901 [Apostasia shenzhenica]|uniref:Cystatin domain-containing protein n=1 Tax=Apostasia shenzhenica TaxID=1088818 RepID=A0A2I0B810_9ASPA|nr:hypothetical protein AXF42_Ash004901 [Apostasia shenzhenica]
MVIYTSMAPPNSSTGHHLRSAVAILLLLLPILPTARSTDNWMQLGVGHIHESILKTAIQACNLFFQNYPDRNIHSIRLLLSPSDVNNRVAYQILNSGIMYAAQLIVADQADRLFALRVKYDYQSSDSTPRIIHLFIFLPPNEIILDWRRSQ